jgi:hypothetical protein
MASNTQYFTELADQARDGDGYALSRLRKELDPHLERIVVRAVRLDEPRSELDRQLRAMARHASAMDGFRLPQRGIIRRVVRSIYDTLWSPMIHGPGTRMVLADTVRC